MKIKTNYFFFLLSLCLLLISGVAIQAYADDAVTTKGTIQLYTVESTSSEPLSDSSGKLPTNEPAANKPTGSNKFPSTGEQRQKWIGITGVVLVLFLVLLFFFRRKKGGPMNE